MSTTLICTGQWPGKKDIHTTDILIYVYSSSYGGIIPFILRLIFLIKIKKIPKK